MKIIQTFWTKPTFGSASKANDSRTLGGWSDASYYYQSWALSCQRLLKSYDRVELYTDQLGKYILIDQLKLPYTNVYTKLDELSHYSQYLWTLGKIHSYSQQNEHFIHVDGDIFIWEDFGKRIHDGKIVAQNLEDNQTYYRPVVDRIIDDFEMPDWLRSELKSSNEILVSNTGLVGGRDTDFIKQYTSLVFQLVTDNKSRLSVVNQGAFSVFLEQYIYYSLARRLGKEITYYIEKKLDYKAHPDMVKVHKVPNQNSFIHPLSNYKKYHEVENFVDMALRTEFSESYFRLKTIFDDKFDQLL